MANYNESFGEYSCENVAEMSRIKINYLEKRKQEIHEKMRNALEEVYPKLASRKEIKVLGFVLRKGKSQEQALQELKDNNYLTKDILKYEYRGVLYHKTGFCYSVLSANKTWRPIEKIDHKIVLVKRLKNMAKDAKTMYLTESDYYFLNDFQE